MVTVHMSFVITAMIFSLCDLQNETTIKVPLMITEASDSIS